jgi:hypothetical protein
MVDIKRIFDSARYIILISFVFNFIAYILYAGLVLLGLAGGIATGSAVLGLGIAGLLAILPWFINQFINFVIIVYGGYRGAKQGLDIVSCGIIGMLSWGIVAPTLGIVQFFADTLFNMGVQTTGLLGNTSANVSASGIIIQLICLSGVYVLGFGVNFVVAILGGLIGGAK